MNVDVKKVFDILGYTVKDKVTNFSGVAASVSFDLYGCVIVTVTPPMNEKGEIGESRGFDYIRLKILDSSKVLDHPFNLEAEPPTVKIDKGPAERPRFLK